jgi:hypothetical protein
MTIEPKPLPYKLLKKKHREHDADYWRELRVLYEGGRRLLRDVETLKKVLHRHAGETEQHYGERLARAFYVNVMATAIDFIVAGLNLDPIRMIPPEGPTAKVDEFYDDFMKNTAPAGADDRVPLQELVREQVRDGLLLGRWATLVDLPPAVSAVSLADQLDQGGLDAYAIPIAIEEVLDWRTVNGRLEWAVRCQVQQERTAPEDDGSLIVETYTVYTADQWWRYVVTYTDPKKQGGERKEPPKDDDVIPVELDGRHSFGRVPLILHVLPVGLWAGNKLASIVKEHFNKSNILAYAEVKDGLQQLYEFLGGEIGGVDTPISENQTDSGRARRQPRGPGLVQVRGKDDRAEYVGPDTSGMAQMRDSVKAAREDAFRVVYQMALAEDNKGALVGRSADSKEKDHAATGVMLGAMGEEGREHATEILDTVARGRKDEPGWTAQGLERFEVSDVSEQIDQAVLLETVSIPSATYQVERKVRLAGSDLGAAATEELMEKIRTELEGAITQDQLAMGGMLGAGMVPGPDGKPVPESQVAPPGGEDDGKPPAKAKKPGKAPAKKPAAKPAPAE